VTGRLLVRKPHISGVILPPVQGQSLWLLTSRPKPHGKSQKRDTTDRGSKDHAGWPILEPDGVRSRRYGDRLKRSVPAFCRDRMPVD